MGTVRSETMLVCNRNDGPEFKGAIFKLRNEIVPNRCKLQSLLAVSVTVPAYTNIENLIKWRTDLHTEAKRCFATHDEDESWLDECRKIVYIQSHAYIFNSSTLFNNVPMAQWSTRMPCNREAAGSNLWCFGFYLKGAHYEVDYEVEKKLT